MENSLNKNFDSILNLKNSLQEGGLRTKNIFKKTNDKNPLISIITVVLNGDKYLEECILSCLNQTYQAGEIILLDNFSDDGTKQILDRYKDKVKIVYKKLLQETTPPQKSPAFNI